MQSIFPIFYFPPISYCKELVKQEKIVFEKEENFIKQTYRNRCEIISANGRLQLIIPIEHNGSRKMKDIKISYSENWQKNHLKSIKTAYQSSPFYEFYEEKFNLLYHKKANFLIDFTFASIQLIFSIIKTPLHNTFTNDYLPNYDIDYRNKYSTKIKILTENTKYIQVFSDRMEFQKDVSIIDLICNIGIKSATYLK